MNNSTLNLNMTEASTNSLDLISFLYLIVITVDVLVALPINVYVIWLIATGSENGMALEFFSLNLSVCEIGIGLLCVLKTMAVFFPRLHRFGSFLLGLAITGRPLFQCLICLERYLAVVHPVTFLKFKPLRYKVFCSMAAWIICLGCCLSCMFILDFLHSLVMYAWLFSVQSLLYFFTELFCLSAVLRALKQSGPGEKGKEREEENHMKRRAFYLILLTTVNMLITYIFLAVSGLYRIATKQYLEDPSLYNLVCFVLAGFVHPVFYLYRAGKLCCFCSSSNLQLLS